MVDCNSIDSPEVIAAIVSVVGALISGIAGFLVWRYKENTQKKMNKELETHKSELDNKKIEIQNVFDNQLERLRVEYGSLYEKRVSAIEKMYSTLYDIKIIKQDICEHLFRYNEESYSNNSEMAKKINSLLKKLDEFMELFDKNKIYFPNISVNKIYIFIKLIKNFTDSYKFHKEELTETVESFMYHNYAVLFPDNFEDILITLENDFRILLGERS